MFTPQRKSPWTPLNPPQSSSRTEPRPRPNPKPKPVPHLTSSKPKTLSFFDAPPTTSYTPPPTTSLANGGFDDGNDNSDDWKRFKEAGLLDESNLERKDRQATLEKLSRLQTELFDYQHNMGLLLIEKKNLASKAEELGQEVSEAMEILKRERAAHLIVVSEAEKREENLKKALNVERKSLSDLERALHDMHEERAKAKTMSDTTVADINARMEELQKQTRDVKEKSYSLEAKLAELDRKNSELDRKLQDLEDRENILHREQSSLTQERESHELYFQKQKKDLIEWERKLEKGEQRLCESRRTLNEREEKLLEIDTSCKVKESDVEELQKKIDMANATLKKVENDTKNQFADLEIKEKNAEAMRSKLEARQKQLQEEEARLDKREKVELEKLLNEHQVILDAKMQEFEADLKRKRSLLEEELKSRKEVVVHKEIDINHREVKLGKREQALEKKTEKVKEKEKDTEMKSKALKEQVKFLKAEERNLESEKKQVNVEKENLEFLKKGIEMLRDDVRKQELHIEEERRNLENAEKERLEYLHLQSNLKQEIENVRRQSEIVEKEVAELKLEREKFEKDWEALDEKRAVVDNELKTLAEKKANFENLRTTEEERLEKERAELEECIRLESESMRLQKESFEAMMEHEKMLLAEKAKNEHAHICEDFEHQKQDLYNDMQKRREEWGKLVEEKERTLEETRLRDITTIKDLKEDAEKTREEMEIERQRMEKEKQELEVNKKQLEETGIDISNDIKALDNLSKKLKKQRVQLVSEKEHFGALIEKIKCCKNCGNSAQAFINGGLQPPTVAGSSQFSSLSRDVMDDVPLRDLNNSKSPLTGADRDRQLGGQMSVLRKCASVIFKASPKIIKEESPHSEHLREQTSIVDDGNVRAKAFASGEPGPAFEKVNDAMKVTQSDVREDTVDNSQTVEFDVHNEAQCIEEPERSDLKSGRQKLGRRGGPGARRAHSVKELVEDAKAILRDDSVVKMEEQPKALVGVNVNNQETTIHADNAHASSARKRSRSQASKVTESEQDIDHSDGNADSVTTVSRRKRRQTVASALSTPGQKRYNLRRHAVAVSGKPGNGDEVTPKDSNQAMRNPNETPTQSLDVAVESSRRLHLVQVSTTRSIEFSSDRCNETANVAENHDDAVKSAEKTLSSEEVKVAEETTLSEEVNETSENVEEDSRSMVNENGDDDDDEDDEDEDEKDHVGQASVGKKIWKFLTS